jgi:hypothetical protein
MNIQDIIQYIIENNSVIELKNIILPKEDLNDIIKSNFGAGKIIGNDMVPIEDLFGGASISDSKKVLLLAKRISSNDGYFERIVIDQDNNVIEGQHRLDALRMLNINLVPVVRVKGYADELAIAMDAINKVGKIKSGHAFQIATHAIDLLNDEETVDEIYDKYDIPQQYEKYFKAAFDAIGIV